MIQFHTTLNWMSYCKLPKSSPSGPGSILQGNRLADLSSHGRNIQVNSQQPNITTIVRWKNSLTFNRHRTLWHVKNTSVFFEKLILTSQQSTRLNLAAICHMQYVVYRIFPSLWNLGIPFCLIFTRPIWQQECDISSESVMPTKVNPINQQKKYIQKYPSRSLTGFSKKNLKPTDLVKAWNVA